MIDIKVEMNINLKDDQDPDAHSKILYDYHYHLWNNKIIREDKVFTLETINRKPYRFKHYVYDQMFYVSSDSIIHTYVKWDALKHLDLTYDIEWLKPLRHLSLTIGGYMIFPSNKIDNKPTINAARGMNAYIKDRFDLTLECIRRWYKGEGSPLYDVIQRYETYFKQFGDFKTFCKFFYVDHLLDQQGNVLFWLPFDDFKTYAQLPTTIDEYKVYKDKVIEFINNRNMKI